MMEKRAILAAVLMAAVFIVYQMFFFPETPPPPKPPAQTASATPRTGPCSTSASRAYSEQVGAKRQALGKSGEISH